MVAGYSNVWSPEVNESKSNVVLNNINNDAKLFPSSNHSPHHRQEIRNPDRYSSRRAPAHVATLLCYQLGAAQRRHSSVQMLPGHLKLNVTWCICSSTRATYGKSVMLCRSSCYPGAKTARTSGTTCFDFVDIEVRKKIKHCGLC